MKKYAMLAAFFLGAVFLFSCRKEDDTLLIDDQEIFESSGTAETTESRENEMSGTDTGEPKPDRVIPVPKHLVSDPTALNLCHRDYWYESDISFAEEEEHIWYVDMHARGNVEHFLHCIDRETGEDRIFCSDPECSHKTEQCGGYLCRGYLLSFAVEDGVVWYCWDEKSESNEIHLSCLDTETGKRVLQNWKIELNNIGNFQQNILPMDIRCIFLKGYVITVQNTLQRESFPRNPGSQALTQRCLIEVWKLPDSVNELDAQSEIRLERVGEIFDQKLEKQYWCKYLALPFSDRLYILEAGEEPENPENAMENWTMKHRYSLYVWEEGMLQPELLLESGEESAVEFWVTDQDIRMLLFEGDEEVLLVSVDPETKAIETLKTLDLWFNSLNFASDRLVSKTMIAGDSSYTEAWQLYDLSGNEITEITGALRDPRYADPEKAPMIDTNLYTVSEEGLYISWKGGVALLPYEGDPVFYRNW